MKIINQLGILFGIVLAGELISYFVPILPASVIGLVILLILLGLKILRPHHIKEVSEFMLKNMAFFFVPLCVGIMQNFHYFAGVWLQFILICLIAGVATFLTAAYTTLLVMKLQKKFSKNKEEGLSNE